MLKNFVRYMHGNVTMTIAEAPVPLIAAVGAAIDYSNAREQSIAIQSALDRASFGAGQLVGSVSPDAFGYVTNGHLGTTSADASRVRAGLDERTLETCANAGSEGGVQIHTVAFQVRDQATLMKMLQDCTTRPVMAFRSDSNGELITTFRQIAQEISTLRLAE